MRVEYRRRERPEFLAKLHSAVDAILHVGRSRIGKHAAVAECARSELGRTLNPRHNCAVRDQRSHPFRERVRLELLVRKSTKALEALERIRCDP